MRVPGSKIVLGIMTDEGAMFELLSKFLGKEGYAIKRVSSEASDAEDLSLVILAPTRDWRRPRSWFENLKKSKPAVLVVQCCDEAVAEEADNVVVLKERPLNLRQLSDTIRTMLGKLDQLVPTSD